VRAEIIAVGSELLLGQIVDTNSAFLAREFAALGLDLYYKTTVGDNLERLEATLRQALSRSHVVVTTGGIGPTADDVTREAVAAATGRELVFSPDLMGQIEAFFAARGFRLSPSNRRQAFVPAGAIVIENPVGTAPAFIVEVGGGCVITLPGVPREMQHLLTTQVLPYLQARYELGEEIRLRVLKTVGLGESRVGEALLDFMEKGKNPTVGTLAHLGQVDVRIAAKGRDAAEAASLIWPVEAEIRRRLGDVVFGADEDTLEGLVSEGLRGAGLSVAVAELGSAGAVAERLAARVGDFFAGGLILMRPEDAERIGADLAPGMAPLETAAALAGAVRTWSLAGVGLGTCFQDLPATSPPVTLVCVAVARDGRPETREYRLGGDAASLRIRCAALALDQLRRSLATARPPGSLTPPGPGSGRSAA
jgi:nicotinamide-nucleotide amidase